MKLPILLADVAGQSYACHGCTNCCRELVVHLTARDVREIDRQNWKARLGVEPYLRLGRAYVLNHPPEGGCVFLSPDGKCLIHSEFGGEAKPLACQLYPFTLNRSAAGLQTGIRFDCPSTAASRGEPLARHKKAVARLADELTNAQADIFGHDAPQVHFAPDRVLTPRELSALVDLVDGLLRDTNRPLIDRLSSLSALLDSLARATLKNVRDDRFEELLGLLAGDLTDAASNLPPPTDRQRRMLRLHVFAHCEHVTLAQVQTSFLSGLSHRWKQLRRSRVMAAGTGAIPSLVAGHHGGTFEDHGRIAPEAAASERDELLTRYLRLRLNGGTAFGPGYYDWPVLTGLQALLLSVPTILWMARYFALTNGQMRLSISDLQRAVGTVDRAAGRAMELGAASASLRVRYLSQENGILRLSAHAMKDC